MFLRGSRRLWSPLHFREHDQQADICFCWLVFKTFKWKCTSTSGAQTMEPVTVVVTWPFSSYPLYHRLSQQLLDGVLWNLVQTFNKSFFHSSLVFQQLAGRKTDIPIMLGSYGGNFQTSINVHCRMNQLDFACKRSNRYFKCLEIGTNFRTFPTSCIKISNKLYLFGI